MILGTERGRAARRHACWLGLALAVAAVGCGDDPLPTINDGGLRDGEVPMAKPPPSTESCLAKHMHDAGISAAARCMCESCLEQTSACDDDPGCTEIRGCMERTGCRDMNQCYFGRAPCRKAIEHWGIMSLALSLAQDLATCSIEQSCVVLQEPECTVIGEFACDGNEDCPSGDSCCGHFNGITYDGSSCAESCDSPRGDAGPSETWTELCHPGNECSSEGETCQAYHLLPAFLNRCEDTGKPPSAGKSQAAHEVNCGDRVCGDGEKCCVRDPKQPYCVAAAVACECKLPTDNKDAGSAEDAGSEDGGQ